MAVTGAQKFAILCLPVASFGLALVTSEGDWNLPRKHYGSLKDAAAALRAAKEAPAGPGPAADPAGAAPAAGAPAETGGKHPQPSGGPPEDPETPGGPAPGAGRDPAPPGEKPLLPESDEIEFRAAGLPLARCGLPLRDRAADRLDVAVPVGGAFRFGGDFVDPGTARNRLAEAGERLRREGLLFVVPSSRADWEPVPDLLVAGDAAGWARIGLAVAHPDNAGQARVYPVTVPSGPVAAIDKGVDPVVVTMGPGPTPYYTLNGEHCQDAAELEAKARSYHEEFDLMVEGYALDMEKTAWTVDGKGAMVAGVVTALDALRGAGIPSVRIAGVSRPAPAGEAPPAEKPGEEGTPADGKAPPPAKPAEEEAKPAEEEEKPAEGDGPPEGKGGEEEGPK